MLRQRVPRLRHGHSLQHVPHPSEAQPWPVLLGGDSPASDAPVWGSRISGAGAARTSAQPAAEVPRQKYVPAF